jgi:hypothetical protein
MTESEIQKGDEGTQLQHDSTRSTFSTRMRPVKALHALGTRDSRIDAHSSCNTPSALSRCKKHR